MRPLLASAALLAVAASCGTTPPPPPPPPPGDDAAEEATAARPEPLAYVEQLTGGADPGDRLPLVITLHGRGATPESFQQFFEAMAHPARLIHLEAPIEEHDGRAWFTFWNHTPQGLANTMATLADRAAETARRVARDRPTRGRPVVTGFSQGAMLVYIMALRHPDAFAAYLPVSGVLPRAFTPDAGARLDDLPPIVAFHGEADPIIPLSAERRTIAMLRAHGANAEIRTFPDIPHWIMGALREDLHRELASLAGTDGGPEGAPREITSPRG
ncbi:MAG: alpha/beta hydrolase [Sandaracinaceae bacterium]